MHNPKKTLILVALCVMLLACVPAGLALGDAGGFSGATDFGSGGGSSSSSGGYSGSSSSDSGDLSFLIYLIYWLVVDVPYGWVIVLLLIGGFIMFSIFSNKGKDKGASKSEKPKFVKVEDTFDKSKLWSIGSYTERDPEFSEEAMREKVSNLYVQMQNAWTDKNFEVMRPYFSDALYAQFDRQLGQLKQRGMTNYINNIAVLSVTYEGWYEEGGQDHICMKVRTRIIDFTVDDKTNKVVQGSESEEKFMTYRWIMSRTTGQTTARANGTTTVNCPNCAAVLDINKTAKCPYCDSIVTVVQHDWVLTAIQGLAQKTGK